MILPGRVPDDPAKRATAALKALLRALPPEQQTPERLAEIALAVVMEAQERPHRLSTHGKRGRVVDVEPGVTGTRASRISAVKTKTPSRLHQLAQAEHLSLPGLHARLPLKTRPSLALMHSWTKASGRPVPRSWAEYLARELKDPSLLLPASWPHGISPA